MRITIKQHIISFGSQYKIFVDKKEELYAETDMLTKAIINVYKPDHLETYFRILKSLYFNYPKYKVEMPNGERLKLESKNLWKTRYQLKKGNDVYDLYCHKGRKVSIFQNHKQIAYWEKEAISYVAGDNYEIVANKDSEKELLIAFCLILDHIHSRGTGSVFNVDFGLIFKEQKRFNEKWKPI